ncbi:IPR001092 Basic helix-loop-helix dimerisation region bHLH,domain-containing protein [Schistosoma mansoni]|nr:IPR001092 Basic helix-loop-helix dimerisation region bHLH,domain-containing protein [Schistosoma mansoni]|eukprot:XP_018644864.1 IPR001092 Basic helix-loop-helix dimerisation region bHLH,domain-containing protein [Schistosoma mansoni]
MMIAMIPQTEIRGNYARVLPIYNTSTCDTLKTQTTGSNLVLQSNTSSKRGRRSNVPPEIREQTRRLKKQSMERKRRACISDKMNALHNLAMNLIGIDPHECHKVEKADILNLCHSVFKGIANIAKDEPELQTRLRKLRHDLIESSSCTTSLPHTSALLSTIDLKEHTDKINKWDNDEHNSHNKKIQEINQFQENQDNHLQDYHRRPQKQQQYPHLNNTISLSSAPTISTTTITHDDMNQRTNENNKENKIPKLIIKNPLLFKNYPTNDCITSSMIKTSTSLPVNNLYLNSTINSQSNETMTQCQSTPLQYLSTFNSTMNNSNSGFVSKNNQSIELTLHSKKMPIFKEHHRLNTISDLTVRSTESSSPLSNLKTKNLPSWSSSSQLISEEHLSAFSAPTRKPLSIITNQLTSNNSTHNNQYYQNQKLIKTITDTIPSSISIPTTPENIETSIKTSVKPMWRPYLD